MDVDHAREYEDTAQELFAQGRFVEAASAFHMAAQLYGHLAEGGPPEAHLHYAMQLTGVASCLSAVEQYDDAVIHLSQAVSVIRPLWAVNATLAPIYAAVLASLAGALTELHRFDEALSPANEAVTIYDELTRGDERFAAELDAAYDVLASVLAQSNR